MPIYEYRCAECSFQEEYLQKISEPPLTVCPSCGKESFRKLLSAAGFQLKGSGWYATDFRNNGSGKTKAADAKSDKGASAESANGSNAAGKGGSDKGTADNGSTEKGSSDTGKADKGNEPKSNSTASTAA